MTLFAVTNLSRSLTGADRSATKRSTSAAIRVGGAAWQVQSECDGCGCCRSDRAGVGEAAAGSEKPRRCMPIQVQPGLTY